MTRIRNLFVAVAAFTVLALASAAPVFAADGIDPGAAKAILAGVFTLSGATVIATIIAAFIQYGLKPLPAFGIGAWVDAHEQITSLALWAFIIVYAVAALALPIDLVSAFGYFLAWLGGAKLSGAAYDTGRTVVETLVAAGSGEG